MSDYYLLFYISIEHEISSEFVIRSICVFFFNSVVAYYQHCSMLDSDYET